MRWCLVVVSVAAAVASVPASAGQGPTVHGYPYAARCPRAGITDVVDRWGMYACNCTSFVAWALQANGQPIDWFIPGAMNAWNWPHVAQLSGLRVDRRPRVGSVAAWPKLSPPFGHVAYVTRVPGPGLVDVAEYNLPGPDGKQTFRFDVRDDVSTAGAVFIHVPRRARG
jgi:surface antigen